MKEKIKVYIASPYTVGDKGENVKEQIDCADMLMADGFVPFVPLYYHFHHIMYHHSYEVWAKLGLEWLKECDCILRLPGISAGADHEVSEARRMDIPIFYSYKELINFYDGKW